MKITITIDDEGKLDINVDGQPPLLAVIGTIEASKTMLLTGDLNLAPEPDEQEVPKEEM